MSLILILFYRRTIVFDNKLNHFLKYFDYFIVAQYF